MQAFELSILDWFQTHLRCGFLDAVLPPITHTCDHGELWILLAVVLLLWKKKRQSGLAVGGALVLDVVSCNVILKPLIGRIRPFAVNPAVELLVERLMGRYGAELEAKYGIQLTAEDTDRTVLAKIATARGCLKAGGVLDLDKVVQIVLRDFRSGKLGRFTLDEA